jgi:hypothetical protein
MSLIFLGYFNYVLENGKIHKLTEFMSAIFAALRLASARVVHVWKLPKHAPPGSVT